VNLSPKVDSAQRFRRIRGLAVAGAVLIGAALAAAPTASAAPGTAAGQPLAPIASLNVERYLGDWNQVAAVPQPFNLVCARDTKANYQLIDPTNVRVENTCTTWTGQTNRIVGNARVTDPITNAQLHVSFPQIPLQNSADGPPNYIVTYIADDYSWALVGNPGRSAGFVLSRSPAVDAAQWQKIRSVVEDRGYNSCLVLTAPTPGGATDIRPLCTV
jgi:apolipoprotein D and lipocalin family protein